MTAALPPPGWYNDPHNPGYQRYWDGRSWTAMTRSAVPHGRPSESNQAHGKSSKTNQSWIKTAADWFNTGTAAVRFAKALCALLVFLGVITVGNAVVGGGSGAGGSGGGGSGGGSTSPANLSATLLQPTDLGVSGAVGWSQTQFTSGPAESCPSFPPNSDEHVMTALTYAAMGINLYEEVWKLADPNQAITTFENTASNCSYTDSSGNTVTFQVDDSDGSYGQNSTIYTEAVTNSAFQGETPTITRYIALIAQDNLLAGVAITTGIEGTLSQSTLNTVFTAAAKRLA